MVGNNLKSLELSEEKALEKEDIFAEQIRQLDFRMKEVRRLETSTSSSSSRHRRRRHHRPSSTLRHRQRRHHL